MDKWEQIAAQAWQAILSKVQAMKAEGKTLQQIADTVGAKNRSLIGEWLNGNREAINAPFSNLMGYLENLGIDYRDIFPRTDKMDRADESAVIRRVAPHAPNEVVQGDGLPQIPVMGGTGAGDDVELFQATPSYWISVLPQYMVHKDIFGLVVYGDSMEPTIHKGAVVGVIPFDGSFNEGGIYLVQRPPFGRTIKRVKLQSGQLVLISDNAAYEPDPLPFEGYEKIILGRVVWVWQMV